MPHDLLVAKFEGYGIGKTGVSLIHNYLLDCKQRTKINSLCGEWYNGFPFTERTNICNFIDNAAIPYIVVSVT